MSQGAEDRIRGFKEQLDIDGETLTLMSGSKVTATVCALVNRGLMATAVKQGQINFSERNASHIQFLITDVKSGDVAVSKVFKDANNFFHRIQVIRRTDIVYMLDCEQSEEP